MIIPFLGVGLGSCLLYCLGKNTSVFHAFLYKLFPAIGNKQGLQRALFSPNNESGVSIGIPAGSHTGYGLSPRAISRWPRAGSILSATRTQLSRFIDKDDWSLNPSVFQLLYAKWGPPTINRFAAYYNAQLPRFNSKFTSPGPSGWTLWCKTGTTRATGFVPQSASWSIPSVI